MWPVLRYYNQGSWSNEFCTEGCEGTWEREAEESPLLEAVARECLVKTQQAGKGLACVGDLWIVEISGGAVITCTYELCV
jgi:hypothetical protein